MDPVRTCIGCRSRSARSGLIRVVSARDGLVVDTAARLPGRGAWVHPLAVCVERACATRAFGRALRRGTRLNDAAVRELAQQLVADPSATRTEKADRTMDNS